MLATRLVGALTRRVGPGRLDLAEDAAQDALLRALRAWALRGEPEDPLAWLVAAARNALIDRLRREADGRAHADRLTAERADDAAPSAADVAEAGDDPLPDDGLRMLFLCCRPELPPEGRVALALKVCCGFGVVEIAAALRVQPEAAAQRIVRAKRRLREIGAAFETPPAAELPARREDVRSVVYALFNEGWRPAAGHAWTRPELVSEAVRLVRELRRTDVGDDPPTRALHALLLFHAARLPARAGADGEPTTLAEQDRSRFDRRLLAEAFAAFASSCDGDEETRWHVEASIASLHAAAPTFEATDWAAVVERYGRLERLAPTPVVRLNRAVACGMAEGAAAGLAAVERVVAADGLAEDPAAMAARAYFLGRSGRGREAADAWRAAAAATENVAERSFFLRRALSAAGH